MKLASFNAKSLELEERLKTKEAESRKNEFENKNEESVEFHSILNEQRKKFETQIAEKNEELCEMTNMFLEKDQKIKSVQISLEEVKESFRLEFENMVSEKDKKWNDHHLICKNAFNGMKFEMNKQ